LSANELTTFHNNTNTTAIRIRQRRQQHYHYNLTILIPAYNEINRIGETLCTYINYMKHQPVYQHHHDNDDDTTTTTTTTTTGQCSILVIDDGSTDGTCQYIHEKKWLVAVPDENLKKECHDTTNNNINYWQVNDQISCISLPNNQGKGAAIARGMMELHTCCFSPSEKNEMDATLSNVRSIVLVADADGSGDISCLNDMIYSLECLLKSSSSSATTTMSDNNNDLAIVVGKRQYPQAKKTLLRSILSWGFRTCVSILFIGTNNNSIKSNDNNNSNTNDNSSSNNSRSSNDNNNSLGVTDTQCGFKLMTTHTGHLLYHKLHLQQWSHDVEVLYRANCILSIPVGECNVNWVDKDGSKLVQSGSVKDAVVMSLMMLSEIGWMRLLYGVGRWNMDDRIVQEREREKERLIERKVTER
jgi:hypothetical protein